MRARAAGLLGTCLALALGSLATPALADPATPDQPEGVSTTAPAPLLRAAQAPGRPEDPRARAEAALVAAKSLLRRRPARSDGARTRALPLTGHDGRDATMVLRELALHLDDLDPADRRAARRVLARPTPVDPDNPDDFGYTVPDAGSLSTDHFAVHWVEEDDPANGIDDRPPGADGDLSTVPSWVQTTADTFEDVYAAIVGAQGLGYLPPLADQGPPLQGPDTKLDVYLVDTGASGTYGYCTSDDPLVTTARQVSAYCVVDNDFSPEDFRNGTPLTNLQVTAAHEFFHAVQAAYDWHEDWWFMEGTAAWVEDEVYDDIDDNQQYLAQSPLAYPELPLDFANPTGEGDELYLPYGNWIFWRFLSERLGPGIVRDVMTAAIGDRYSLQAVKRVLGQRGLGFGDTFAAFGIANRSPRTFYSEGALYPTAPLAARIALTKRRPRLGPVSMKQLQLSTRTVQFRPGTSLKGRWQLRVAVDLPPRSRGSLAHLVIYRKGGGTRVVPIALSRTGEGARTVDFTRSRVRHVELAVTNAGTRYVDCGTGTPASCGGRWRDHWQSSKLAPKLSARAVR